MVQALSMDKSYTYNSMQLLVHIGIVINYQNHTWGSICSFRETYPYRPQGNRSAQPNGLVPHVSRMVNDVDPSGTDDSRVCESLRPELGQRRGKVDRLQNTKANYSSFFKSHASKKTLTPTQCEGIMLNVGQPMHSWY
jgi:hypothetical protein